jgi:hypothetical protein
MAAVQVATLWPSNPHRVHFWRLLGPLSDVSFLVRTRLFFGLPGGSLVLGGRVMESSDSLSDSADVSPGVVVFVERDREVARDQVQTWPARLENSKLGSINRALLKLFESSRALPELDSTRLVKSSKARCHTHISAGRVIWPHFVCDMSNVCAWKPEMSTRRVQTWHRGESGRVGSNSTRIVRFQPNSARCNRAGPGLRLVEFGSMHPWFGLNSTRLKTQWFQVRLGSTRESHTKCVWNWILDALCVWPVIGRSRAILLKRYCKNVLY